MGRRLAAGDHRTVSQRPRILVLEGPVPSAGSLLQNCPTDYALAGKTTVTRLQCSDNRYLELHITPIHGMDGQSVHLISLGRDVTAEVNQQQKLNALHQAGRELAALAPDQLADMVVEERVELLKLNLRRIVHDLLHYDVIEIRLLNRQTSFLEPLLAEGMTPEAPRRELRASATGNGV